jgi:transglutaminase-like putative cysteine protease
MRLLVQAGKRHDEVRSAALAIVGGVAPKDFGGEIAALFDFVQNDIRYTLDPRGLEQLHHAEEVLRQRAGDCDDMVILLGAMLESIGHRTKIFAMGFEPGQLTHVILKVWYAGRWLALDPTEDQPAGWLPRGIRQTMEIDNGDGDD